MNPQLQEELRRIHQLQSTLEIIEMSLATKGNRDRATRAAAWANVLGKVQAQVDSMKLPAPTVVETQTLPLDNTKTA